MVHYLFMPCYIVACYSIQCDNMLFSIICDSIKLYDAASCSIYYIILHSYIALDSVIWYIVLVGRCMAVNREFACTLFMCI